MGSTQASWKSMKRQNAGFTLIEIAIVLVIIGLLIGGVLKGQELIENAKIKNITNDFQGISAAYYAYQDRYHALPGDDAKANNANRGWTDATAGNGNGIYNTGDAFATGNQENMYAWQHLRYSGLLNGDPAGATANAGGRGNPLNSYGGQMGIGATTAAWGLGLSGNILCAGSVPGKAAAALDTALDDGNPNTGQMRALQGTNNAEPAGVVPATSYIDNGATFYTICKTL